MAVVAFVNPKGGSGKTTLSLVLAEQYASQGLSVAVIDTDPNGFHDIWKKGRLAELGSPGFDTMFEREERNVIRVLEDAADKKDTVLVDTEGTSSKTVTRVISRAHLVIVPINPSTMDASQASRAVTLIKEDAHMLGRDIEFRLIFSRTKNIKSRTHRNLITDLKDAGLPVLETQMVERSAFIEIFEYNATVRELIENANNDMAEAAKEGRKTDAKAAEKKIEAFKKAAINAENVATEITDVLAALAEVV